MIKSLYPILFQPTYHYRIWGGRKLLKFGKNITEDKIGESWEISTIPQFVSEVSNGELKSQQLTQLIKIYKEQLVGTKVYEKFGEEFPLLIKFLDSEAPLSVQVHPGDEYAKKHYNSLGKSEMWYILEAAEDAEIIIGFKEGETKEEIIKGLKEGEIKNKLRKIQPKQGDVFYIPSGRVHAIGKGITLVEIQQASDITYRIYDYNRIDKTGEKRELHISKAMDVVDFSYEENLLVPYDRKSIEAVVAKTPYFTVSRWGLSENKKIDHLEESFRILVCVEGSCIIESEANPVELKLGQTVLIPASLKNVNIKPKDKITLLEVHIDL